MKSLFELFIEEDQRIAEATVSNALRVRKVSREANKVLSHEESSLLIMSPGRKLAISFAEPHEVSETAQPIPVPIVFLEKSEQMKTVRALEFGLRMELMKSDMHTHKAAA